MTTNRILNDLAQFDCFPLYYPVVFFAQQNDSTPKMENQFWKTYSLVWIGLGFGSGFTDISVCQVPFITSMNTSLSGGIAIQIPKQRDFLRLICMEEVYCTFEPINEIQLSAELEQLRVNVNDGSNTNSQNYWNTDYLWEQVTALNATGALQCANGQKQYLRQCFLCHSFLF
jgi:hypothetical protein